MWTLRQVNLIRKLRISGMALLIATAVPVTAAGQHASTTGRGGVPAEERAQPRAPTTKSCSANRIKYKASTLKGSSTDSTGYKSIPQAAISFVQGGAKASCVIVHFSTLAFAPNGALFLRALLDGSASAIPSTIQLTGDDDENNTAGSARMRSVIFIFPSVTPGSHKVRIQYRSDTAGKLVYIHEHNTVVHHRK